MVVGRKLYGGVHNKMNNGLIDECGDDKRDDDDGDNDEDVNVDVNVDARNVVGGKIKSADVFLHRRRLGKVGMGKVGTAIK